MSSEKTILPSLKNIEWKTLMIETNKIDHILPYIPTNNTTELNELIYAGAKLVLWENWDPLKKHEETVKTGMGNSTGNANKKKKTTKTSPNDKKGWRVWEVCWRQGHTATYWPKIPLFLILIGFAQPWVTEGPKPYVCRLLSIRHLVSNCLKLSVSWLYFCLTPTCFRCSSAYLHRCISWLTARSSVYILHNHPYYS